ncbi:hypothetical protein V1505DRAFT_388084 [Lipomyces doorenjongii]
MTRPSSKYTEQSINGRKNVLKRFDRASQAVQSIAEASAQDADARGGQDADARGGQDAEELQVVEVRLRQSEIDNALKRLWLSPEADKRLKYTTRPGGIRTVDTKSQSKIRNVDASTKPLTAFNSQNTEVSGASSLTKP